jgi:hypothetical protein
LIKIEMATQTYVNNSNIKLYASPLSRRKVVDRQRMKKLIGCCECSSERY